MDRLQARRAVEALRSGVPSTNAVWALGSGQPELESQFSRMLDGVESAIGADRQDSGMMIRGGFGSGKSHVLMYFERMALERGFAVSKVVISKETPLKDPAKVLAAAVADLRVPRTLGRGLDEVGLLLRGQLETDGFQALVSYLASGWLNMRFGATLHLYAYGHADEELADRCVRFWSGDKLTVTEIRRYLKQMEVDGQFKLESIKARELALQTMSFIPRLIRAAGLKGWVLLIDEVELIGRYSRLARGLSYAELGRWLGEEGADQRPGLVTVAAITDDFAAELLHGRGDLGEIPAYLDARPVPCGELATRGMQRIERARWLEALSQDVLRKSYQTIRELHGQAYDWKPGDVPWPEALGVTPMRIFVRAWINAWDIQRLYPERGPVGYDIDQVTTDYAEEKDLEGSFEEVSQVIE